MLSMFVSLPPLTRDVHLSTIRRFVSSFLCATHAAVDVSRDASLSNNPRYLTTPRCNRAAGTGLAGAAMALELADTNVMALTSGVELELAKQDRSWQDTNAMTQELAG